MKFRDFIMAEAGLSGAGFGQNVRYGFWGFPSLNLGGLTTNRIPPGGYTNLGHMAQHAISRSQFNDPDYILQQTLEKLAQLSESAVEGINHQQNNPDPKNKHFLSARYDQARGTITGLLQNDIVSGLFPRLRLEDMRRAEELKIITQSATVQGGFDINVNVLKQQMMSIAQKLADKQHAAGGLSYVAGQIDQGVNLATSPGRVSLDRSANPFA